MDFSSDVEHARYSCDAFVETVLRPSSAVSSTVRSIATCMSAPPSRRLNAMIIFSLSIPSSRIGAAPSSWKIENRAPGVSEGYLATKNGLVVAVPETM